MLKWNEVLENWKNGNHPKMPNNINKPFLWRTSVLNKNIDLPYKEEFIEDKRLFDKNRQDLKTFKEHFNKKKNINKKHVISFSNLPGDTMMVVPVPKSGKQFTNIYHFMKNASKVQQEELWKLVAKEAKKMLKKYDNIWISTQGLGVNYLHVRICSFPKYYEKSKLQKLPKILSK